VSDPQHPQPVIRARHQLQDVETKEQVASSRDEVQRSLGVADLDQDRRKRGVAHLGHLPRRFLELGLRHIHGSWLNIAEIELSALARQCLDRRIADLDILNVELNATNADQRQVNWHFATSDARTRLRHLYPER
jgi:hypothetical protein